MDDLLKHATEAAKEKRFDESVSLLDQVLERDGDNLRALDLFGFVRFFQKRYQEAEQCCRRALDVEPNRAYALKGLGLCLARQGRLDEGCASLEQAIEKKPGWFDPYWDLAVVLYEAGKGDEALEVLARGKAAIPEKSKQFEGLASKIQRHQKPVSQG